MHRSRRYVVKAWLTFTYRSATQFLKRNLKWLIRAITVVLILIVIASYLRRQDYVLDTGFESKSLWEWGELLIVPLVLAVVVVLFNRTQKRTELEIASDQQSEVGLQAYMDKMTELLIDKELRNSTEDSDVRAVARARTLTVLSSLDGLRKGAVVRFLHESGLIQGKNPVINMWQADLSGAMLRGVKLSEADIRDGATLTYAHLSKANLSGAILTDADLSLVDMQDAILNHADLRRANLKWTGMDRAKLIFTDLRGANLWGAWLDDVNLTNAQVTEKQLAEVGSLEGVTMPLPNMTAPKVRS